MATLLYLYSFLLTIAAACLADLIPLRSPSNRPSLRSGAARPLPPLDDYHYTPPSQEGDVTNDLELLDIVLVASVDGKFHALSRSSGQALWSMSGVTDGASSPSTLAPLVRTMHPDSDPDFADDASHEQYIIEPQTGDIYVMSTPSSPLQRFPFTMSELVDMSPFFFSDGDVRRVFVGKKETSLLLVELETGKLKATIDSECPWDPFEDLHDDVDEIDLDELEGSKPPIAKTTDVFIGRTDYHISIHTRPIDRHSSASPVPIQNLSFSTYGPNNQDTPLQALYRRTKDDAYIQSLPNGEILSFKASNPDSSARADTPFLWAHAFSQPTVAVFDVLRRQGSGPHSDHPFVLLQPRPGLLDFLPTMSPDARLPNDDSAYVGIVEQSGSLFAMSPARYPLVAFGNADRPTMPLLDGPVHTGYAYDDDFPQGIDEITRHRKLREREAQLQRLTGQARCEDATYAAGDRRCLVGMRRLAGGDAEASSRIKRLLDGVPQVPTSPASVPEPSSNASTERSDYDAPVEPDRPSPPRRESVGGYWQAVGMAFMLGALSLWFGLRRFRPDLTSAPMALAPGSQIGEEISNIPMQAAISRPATPLLSDLPTPALEVSDLQTPSAKVQYNVGPGDDAEESDKENEGDVDAPATPGKKKVRRGKRGKGKKKGAMNGSDAQAIGENNGVASSPLVTPAVEPAISLVLTASSEPTVPTQSLVVTDTILGFGSHGTVVYQGSLQGRAVAVKRLLKDFVTLASREVSILQESDDHPNVIRYYYQEAHSNFLYIALELCPASLADIIEQPDKEQFHDIALAFDPKRALRQVTSGLRHLHALKLVHRDIKPQNILVSSAKNVNGKPGYRMLISDFGLCKKLDVDQTSFLPTAYGAMAAGTAGWRAPEILRGEVKLDDVTDEQSMSSRGSTSTAGSSGTAGATKPTRLTKSVDIFALGCLFYYTLTNGAHPFGDRYEREVNIMKNIKCLEGLQRFGEEGSEAVDLITRMLDPVASTRPDTTACLVHPFFWEPSRRLNFLQDASDRFEIMCRDPKDPNLIALETGAFDVVGNDWHGRLDKGFVDNLGKFRKYDGRSVQDLLRALRNKKHHYQDLPDNVKRNLGPMPEGFLGYFTRRFPRLFLHVHGVIGDTILQTESMFRSYFELPSE
ncbi:hypothetical protein BD626DRAFT_581628 [Schizophyllum amplum]|uniref:non-specific serine/threonine protein kinase n=1 Tax=Schizophyllum amplum TaxID=97359 RepID=A0A550CPX7_9AGAR|nr:hypothetical protein BD626DRAFT_581628 [Auriculariopsis ampla]